MTRTSTPQGDAASGRRSVEGGPGSGSLERAARDDEKRPSRKTVEASRVEISQLMRPQQGNFAGNVHGGVLLGLMDEAAYVCASRYAEAYCVTVAVDHVKFDAPVKVGERVTLEAAVNAGGGSSTEVGITVSAEEPQRPGSRRETNRSFFTMVALDGEGEPAPVPDLVCETAADHRQKCEAELRRELREQFEQELEAGMCQVEAI